jgi:hypothetical protein
VNSLLALIIVGLNVAVTLFTATRPNRTQGDRNILFEGNCNRARQYNVAAHFLINALGTILLSTSNYEIQFLSAVTRNEVDVARVEGMWLDIGVLSVRNIERKSSLLTFYSPSM